MKTYMPLDGFRWSCDSDSALCDMRQTNVLGRAGGAVPSIFCPFLIRQHGFSVAPCLFEHLFECLLPKTLLN